MSCNDPVDFAMVGMNAYKVLSRIIGMHIKSQLCETGSFGVEKRGQVPSHTAIVCKSLN